jgi:hypothetical protein
LHSSRRVVSEKVSQYSHVPRATFLSEKHWQAEKVPEMLTKRLRDQDNLESHKKVKNDFESMEMDNSDVKLAICIERQFQHLETLLALKKL